MHIYIHTHISMCVHTGKFASLCQQDPAVHHLSKKRTAKLSKVRELSPPRKVCRDTDGAGTTSKAVAL